MIARKNSQGLFVFKIKISNGTISRTLMGCADTGSTDCAATYKCITPFHLKPVDWTLIQAIGSYPHRTLVYNGTMCFDHREMEVPIVRVPNTPDGVDFILGLSVLEHCTIRIDNDKMYIDWESDE